MKMAKRIKMKGPLIPNNSQEAYDYFGLEAVSAKSITDFFPEDNGDIILEVNSNGGLVTVGSEIYSFKKLFWECIVEGIEWLRVLQV